MVCPGCGELNTPKCLNCDQFTLYRPDAPDYSHPNGLRFRGYPDEYVVEGKDSDGSDWFHVDTSPRVSNRAKEWMERTHAFPIKFEPLLLNIEGVEDRFKAK